MSDLLLELFSEEIPARMQRKASLDLVMLMEAKLKEAGLKISLPDHALVTPRRLALILKDLPVAQPDVTTELKGPKIDAPEAALQGFLKKNNLTLEQLEKRNGVYFAQIHQKGKPTAEVLKEIIEKILTEFPWPKSMRWGSGEVTWVRPLHSILCIFDGKIVPVEFAGIKAGNVTYGHRFLAPKEIKITNATDYEKLLEKAFVIADREKRKAEILKQAEKAAQAEDMQLKEDVGLLDEVTGLVEWPVVLVGTIDAAFRDLPSEILISEMRTHQKYFALRVGTAVFSPFKFLITSNMETKDKGKAIIAGNERVLRARLADGRFFWDQDRKKTLDEWAEGLKNITFHAKLGSIADKVERIKMLAVALTEYVPDADKKLVERAAKLCKADLMTGIVGEFPELQGVMGYNYAPKDQVEDIRVADAIRDHYKPQGPNDSVPTNPVSICIALADKLDTLISMFAIGEKPTGSKDPFALRRAALGVIRIVLENNIRLPLKTCFIASPAKDIALHKAHEDLAKKTAAKLHEPAASHKVGKYLTLNETAYADTGDVIPPNLADMLYDFFADRLKVQLKDSGIRHDVIDAIIANGDDDLVRIVKFAHALQPLIVSEQGKKLLYVYNRAHNIVVAEEKKDKCLYNQPVEPEHLQNQEEKILFQVIQNIAPVVEMALKEESFNDLMEMVDSMRPFIESFFEKVMVNDSDVKIRRNRLNLLSELCRTLNKVADFALIEG